MSFKIQETLQRRAIQSKPGFLFSCLSTSVFLFFFMIGSYYYIVGWPWTYGLPASDASTGSVLSFFITLSVRREFRLERRDGAFTRGQSRSCQERAPTAMFFEGCKTSLPNISYSSPRREEASLCNISSYVQETAWNDQGHNSWLQQMEGRGKGNHARVIRQPVTVALNLRALVNTT